MKALTIILTLTLCSCAYQPPPGPMTAEEQREYMQQQRQDTWILTLLAIIPGAVIASK